MDRQTDREINKGIDRQAGRQTDGQPDREIYRGVDRQKGRQTDRQTVLQQS